MNWFRRAHLAIPADWKVFDLLTQINKLLIFVDRAWCSHVCALFGHQDPLLGIVGPVRLCRYCRYVDRAFVDLIVRDFFERAIVSHRAFAEQVNAAEERLRAYIVPLTEGKAQ